MKKKNIMLCGLAIVLAVTTFLIFTNPFKVTDPNDPRFDPAKFQFEDYSSEVLLLKTLDKIFPQGTSQSDIEKLLVDKLHLKKSKRQAEGRNYYIVYVDNTSGKISYFHPFRTARFLYDGSDNSVLKIQTDFWDGGAQKYFAGDYEE